MSINIGLKINPMNFVTVVDYVGKIRRISTEDNERKTQRQDKKEIKKDSVSSVSLWQKKGG
ncbi:hypothetical protein KAW18_06155 [candidate division WOR-3 bacterium]|nr:hypothetical protein [candidate division WOR-3 bacterium]